MKYLLLFLLPASLLGQPALHNDGLLHVEAGATLTVAGELTNTANATLQNEGLTQVSGDLDQAGSYQPGSSGKLRLYGPAAATLSGNLNGSNALYRFEVAKTPGQTVTLSADLTVLDTLRLSGGVLATGAFEVFLDNPNKGTITGHPSAGAAVDDRYIFGTLRRTLTLTGSLYDFPVGDAPGLLGYQLMRFNASDLDGMSELTVDFVPGATSPAFASECGATFDCALSGHGQWQMTPDLGTPTYSLSVMPRNFAGACGSGSYTLMVGGALSGAPCSGVSGSLDPVNGTEVTRNDLTGFGPIAITGSASSFPVEWLRFTAVPAETQVRLDWITGQELNNDHFVVERSADGRSFVPIGQVAGHGTTQQMRDYRFFDAQPQRGINYYRLRQVDLDGRFQHSKVRSVIFERLTSGIAIGPNPVRDRAELRYPVGAPLTLYLFTAQGQAIGRYALPATGQASLNLEHLAKGTYFYRAVQAGQTVAAGKLLRR